ncbi:hypothetical protein [Paenibacillus sp. NEAU-GSW1]|uniref:hypothetical protein n=1 Tax=Paenibacillus sp. NEAU-GSW1 TaxID=2682486 RepID=UPI0012E1FA8D|nr:hypothetical protein [Paenibacillus sp. NEAU-GSW1]MUT67738.1 hypothetical protein [Paenibacillus sp. NEAU-GSW1]
MIVWKGFGILNVLIVGLMFVVFHLIMSSIGLENESGTNSFGIAFLVSALPIWFLGKKLNSGSNRVLVDPQTGIQYRMGTQHSLFFVPMQYWGPIAGVLGILTLLLAIFS